MSNNFAKHISVSPKKANALYSNKRSARSNKKNANTCAFKLRFFLSNSSSSSKIWLIQNLNKNYAWLRALLFSFRHWRFCSFILYLRNIFKIVIIFSETYFLYLKYVKWQKLESFFILRFLLLRLNVFYLKKALI